VLVLAPAAAGADGSCATLQCSVHKMEGRPCQCNFHCDAHHDCCSDFATVCSNLTDPCLQHQCKHNSAAAATSIEAKAHDHSKAHSGSSTGNATSNEAKTHDHLKAHAANSATNTTSTKGSASSTHEKETKSGGKDAKDAKNKAATDSKGGHGKQEEGESKKGHEHSSGSKESSSGASKSAPNGKSGGSAGSKEAGGKDNKQHTHEHAKAESEHTKAKHETISWIIVLLACATGLTVPVTVSIVLILRARGVCCVPTIAHHRIDQQGAPTATAADGVPTTGDRELYAVPESSEEEASAAAPAASGLPAPIAPNS